MFKKIGIVTRQDQEAVRDVLETILPVCAAAGAEVALDRNGAAARPRGDYEEIADVAIAAHCDLVIAIGGDGTLLRAAQMTFPRNVPLTGINLGRLGFLTDLSPERAAPGIAAILRGDFQRESRFVLECSIVRHGKTIAINHSLNDVIVQRWRTARLITLNTYVDGRFVHAQRADGLIIATPTGSTAYALSGGGPILYPVLDVVVLVPICPHTLTNRPIVISNDATIEVELPTDEMLDARVTCDGHALPTLASADRIRVRRHDQNVELLHPAGHDHFATLRAKLQWGRDPC